ncbi:heterokaryon incompatibility protein-domain-containing protein [Xylaria scruposa]|nr:heterokaryon incompatibility protein-domain-containing protein [Xylaria scruposa]
MRYQYSPLGSDCIRLLKPHQSRDEAHLSFTMHHVSRSEVGCFTALTYAWGNEEATETISLNNLSFCITPHLRAFLGALSRAVPGRQWDRIWVDAICIDQTNDRERNEQVREMHKIYQGAECVSLWLGSLPDSDHGDFKWEDAGIDLAKASVWSRRWILQELLLARNIEVYCGRKSILWDEFMKIFGTVLLMKASEYVTTYDQGRGGFLGFATSIIRAVKDLILGGNVMDDYIWDSPNHGGDDWDADIDSMYHALPLIIARNSGRIFAKGPRGISLRKLLTRFHRFECKDPRDRVFALLSLLPKRERDSLAEYFPDYSLSKDQVVIIALAHLQHWRGYGRPVTVGSNKLFDGLGIEKQNRLRFLELGEAFHYYKLLPRSPPKDLGRWFRRVTEFSVICFIIAVMLWTVKSIPYHWKASLIEDLRKMDIAENGTANGIRQMNSTFQTPIRR